MPGIVFLDAQGNPIGTARLKTAQEFVQQLNELAAERPAAQPEKANPEKTAMTKQVTVAVTGMI